VVLPREVHDHYFTGVRLIFRPHCSYYACGQCVCVLWLPVWHGPWFHIIIHRYVRRWGPGGGEWMLRWLLTVWLRGLLLPSTERHLSGTSIRLARSSVDVCGVRSRRVCMVFRDPKLVMLDQPFPVLLAVEFVHRDVLPGSVVRVFLWKRHATATAATAGTSERVWSAAATRASANGVTARRARAGPASRSAASTATTASARGVSARPARAASASRSAAATSTDAGC